MAAYRYSAPHKLSASLVAIAPNGRLVASAVAYRLIVRDIDTLQIVQVSQVDCLAWLAYV